MVRFIGKTNESATNRILTIFGDERDDPAVGANRRRGGLVTHRNMDCGSEVTVKGYISIPVRCQPAPPR